MGKMQIRKVRAFEEWAHFRENSYKFWKPGQHKLFLISTLIIIPYLTYRLVKIS